MSISVLEDNKSMQEYIRLRECQHKAKRNALGAIFKPVTCEKCGGKLEVKNEKTI